MGIGVRFAIVVVIVSFKRFILYTHKNIKYFSNYWTWFIPYLHNIMNNVMDIISDNFLVVVPRMPCLKPIVI